MISASGDDIIISVEHLLTVPLALKAKLGQALSSYLPLCIDVSLPLRHRLEELQKVFNLYPGQPSKALHGPTIDGVNVNALQFESSVMDGPVVNTRAGLYVYINSMVRFSLRGNVGFMAD